MQFETLEAFGAGGTAALGKGPVALLLAEDAVELEGTLAHLLGAGFATVVLFGADYLPCPAAPEGRLVRVIHDMSAPGATEAAVNAAIAAGPGLWMHYCYNAEYLFHPFAETRSVAEMLAFHAEERRDAMLTYVIDLYAGDLAQYPDGVAPGDTWLDRSGYYALERRDAAKGWAPVERQLDVFGGLKWRFEEHVPWRRRRIDRIGLFRAKPGLALTGDHVFNDAEYNTYACPWHHNLTAAICSFRSAKALRLNPGSRDAIGSFRWHNSVRFTWQSQQLMDLGLMEPGQWF